MSSEAEQNESYQKLQEKSIMKNAHAKKFNSICLFFSRTKETILICCLGKRELDLSSFCVG